jgi:hypothetical protein
MNAKAFHHPSYTRIDENIQKYTYCVTPSTVRVVEVIRKYTKIYILHETIDDRRSYTRIYSNIQEYTSNNSSVPFLLQKYGMDLTDLLLSLTDQSTLILKKKKGGT